MELAGLLIAAASLGLLVNQEVRRYRNRPFARITADVTGQVNVDDEWLDLVEIVNAGTEPAIIDIQHWFGVRPRMKGQVRDGLDLKIPKTMEPGKHVRMGVRGDLDTGWLRLVWHTPGSKNFEFEWIPLKDEGPLDEIATTQWEAMKAARRARLLPRFWTRQYWRAGRKWKPGPVAPVPEGRLRLRHTPSREKRYADEIIAVVTSADHNFVRGDLGDAPA